MSEIRDALLLRLGADVDVAAALGDPLRVIAAGASAPAYPCLEIARHEVRPADAAEAEAEEHRIDLALLGPENAEDVLLEGLRAVRAALTGWKPDGEGWRCVLLSPVFADALRAPGRMRRATLRVRVIVEAVVED